MKIICWNVEGAKKSQLRHEVGLINRTIKPNILILLETLVNCQNTDLIINQLGFNYSSTIPPVNHMGVFGYFGMMKMFMFLSLLRKRALCIVWSMIN